MGAGAYGAGIGPGGFDPVLDPSLPSVYRLPDAVYIDLIRGDFTLQEVTTLAGTVWRSIHPVDQAVLISFGVRKGTYMPDRDIGHELRDLPRVSGERLIEEVKARVVRARPFADLVRDGFAEYLDAVVQSHKGGSEVRVAISYRNLQLIDEDPRVVRVNASQ